MVNIGSYVNPKNIEVPLLTIASFNEGNFIFINPVFKKNPKKFSSSPEYFKVYSATENDFNNGFVTVKEVGMCKKEDPMYKEYLKIENWPITRLQEITKRELN